MTTRLSAPAFTDENGKQQTEEIKHDEKKALYHENKIRAERGLPERVAYDAVIKKDEKKTEKKAEKVADPKAEKKKIA